MRPIALGFLFLFSMVPLAAFGQQSLRDFRRVIVADQAPAVQRTAAEELAHYAGALAGTHLEVVVASKVAEDVPGLSFLIGDGPAGKFAGQQLAPWKNEEYVLRSVPRGLVLAGDDAPGNPWAVSTRAGSLLAVYTLLDDYCGVHWFWPGPFGEHLPAGTEIVVPPLNVRATPKFLFRSIPLGYDAYHTAAYHADHMRWMRRNRLGATRPAAFGHAWFDAFQRQHDEFPDHPEWFALVKGVRQPPQMCTTNPEVIERMVRHVVDGPLEIMHISPSDGGGFCECARCRALDLPGRLAYDHVSPELSDRIYTYANEVARRVRAQKSEKGVGILAYTFYNRPPEKAAALEPNLYVAFAYQSAGFRNPDALVEWRASTARWKELGARLVAREAWGLHYYADLPLPHDGLILSSTREAYAAGFVGATGDGSKAFATQAPNYWALTRALWNPECDAAGVMDEFYRTAYGPAAGEMRAFFDAYSQALDANWTKQRRLVDTSLIAYQNLTSSWHLLYPPEVVAQAERHLQAAEKSAPPGEFADRVAFHRFGQTYTAVVLELYEQWRRLAELGVDLIGFRAARERSVDDPADRQARLQRAYELGEKREAMLLAHRAWAALNEGLYAYLNDHGIRQWHAQVKEALGLRQPSALTKESLRER